MIQCNGPKVQFKAEFHGPLQLGLQWSSSMVKFKSQVIQFRCQFKRPILRKSPRPNGYTEGMSETCANRFA